MGERTSYEPGTFCWVDLGARNPAAARHFYGTLLGWEFREIPGYWLAHIGGRTVAGLYAGQQQPAWHSYVAVADAQATADRARELGGSVLDGPFPVGDFGSTLAMTDPQGALICGWQAAEMPGAELVNAPGALCWNELRTSDVALAEQFYGPLFGWTFAGWSEADEYVVCQVGDRANGGISSLAADQEGTPPNWGVSFGCSVIGDALSRARDLGASVVMDVTDMPNLGSFAVLADPEGAVFSVFEGEFAD